MTTPAQHTPGPWHVNAVDTKRGRIVGDETAEPGTYDKLQVHGGNRTIATVYRPKDARLIAAAPEMREWIQGLMAAFDHEERSTGYPQAVQMLRARLSSVRALLARIDGADGG